MTLLKAGATVNQVKPNGTTALHLAAGDIESEGDNEVVVRALLRAGAEVNTRSWQDGATPLMRAAENGNLAVVVALLEAKAQVNMAKHD